MSEESDTGKPKPRPLLAVAITGVLVGLAIQDQLSSGSVDAGLLSAIVLLALFWAGQGIDRLMGR